MRAYLLDPAQEEWENFVADLESIPNWRENPRVRMCCGSDCGPHGCIFTDMLVEHERHRRKADAAKAQ